ncbi:MAG: DUF3000 domain-containing protein [Pseudolysinimonas sp.]|uniref:DUF3000 domain-containing protein n=1 Tax=Pseudolysinimonas sp. TaxID=2680009 RepID=UPI0032643E61
MATLASDPVVPAPFGRALTAVRRATIRPELQLGEIPAPTGLAPHAIAMAADVSPVRHGIDSVLGTGRFVLLYDPEEPDAWGGPFRVVCFAQAPLETDIGLDPFVAEVAWSWLEDALEARDAHYTAASGTATKVLSTGFGELSHQSDGAQLEVRASWTPDGDAIGASVEAWSDLLCQLAGLPPTAEAVGLLPNRRGARG